MAKEDDLTRRALEDSATGFDPREPRRTLVAMAASAVSDFATDASLIGVEAKIRIDVQPKPHKPGGLPPGKMAVYCFFLDGQALKIGKAGANSGPRFRSQHYNPNSARSNLAKSILTHPGRVGLATLPRDVGEWIKTRTDRVNLLLPAGLGESLLSELETFLHRRWNPTFEGRVASIAQAPFCNPHEPGTGASLTLLSLPRR